jgi:thioredoxin 1
MHTMHNMHSPNDHALNDDNFAARIAASTRPILVQFTAAWCPPCRPMHDVVALIAKERSDIDIGFLDVEESPRVTQQYGVRAMPTFLVFVGGTVKAQIVGAMPRAKLEAWLASVT